MSASTSTSVDKFIRTHLLSLQNSFFQSLQTGTDAVLTAFNQEMVAFNETLSHCVQDLQEETYLLIYSFVQMSNAVIPDLIDLDIATEKINQELTEEITKVLNELSLNDFTVLEPETYPPYIQPAYAWLLSNIHNPYPSKYTRATISKQTNTPQKDIDFWFTDVRKRIGWNSLRKKHFSTRKDMIAAATRFFKPSSTQLDSTTGLEDPAHFDQEFALLEDSAKNLYLGRFSTSNLANGLDVVKDVTPEINPAGQGIFLAREVLIREIEPLSDSPHPSPEFVPSPPTPSPPSPPPSPSQRGRKRRQSTWHSNPSIEARPHKRMRNDVSANPMTHSPLPSTESDPTQDPPSLLDSSLSPIPTISISETSRKRKRQSLDSDSDSDQGRMKRAYCIRSSPSSSLMEPPPSGSSNLIDVEHWLKSLCSEGIDLGHSIPEPVYETSPLTAAVEIDFYRYASSSPSTSVTSLVPATPPDYNTSDFPAVSDQSLSWVESPSLTKAQVYNNLTDGFLSTNWSEDNFLFNLHPPGILDVDFPFQNWDLGSTPTVSTNDHPISHIPQEVVDELTFPGTNTQSAVPISVSDQLSPLTSFSDHRDNIPLPQVFQHPSLDKKGAKIRYLQTLLNEVQNVRLDLAL